MSYSDAQIAQVYHEANRALQAIHLAAGDKSIAVSDPWMLDQARPGTAMPAQSCVKQRQACRYDVGPYGDG